MPLEEPWPSAVTIHCQPSVTLEHHDASLGTGPDGEGACACSCKVGLVCTSWAERVALRMCVSGRMHMLPECSLYFQERPYMMPLYKDGLFGTNSIMFRMLVHKDPVYCTSLKDLTKYTKLLVVWGFFRGLSFRLPIRRARLIELIDRVHRFSMSWFGSEV